MSILHGDVRFYNNVFVQQPVREQLQEICKPQPGDPMEWDDCNLECGTASYSGYMTQEQWESCFEGYCGEDDWKRAYGEINEFEKELADYGTIVLKFWIHIDPETQLERFELRQNTPEKQWKITDEDWRNREKWPLYETAVEEMLQKTSTAYAPWHIIESVDKKYARIRVLQIVTDALEQAVNEHITRGVKKECAKPKKDRS